MKTVEEVLKAHVTQALREEPNVTRCAQRLVVGKTTLYRWIAAWDLKLPSLAPTVPLPQVQEGFHIET